MMLKNRAVEGPLLGIDPGTVWLGLARSDPLGFTFTPLPPLKKKENFLHDLLSVVQKGSYWGVVIGLPLSQAGEETRISKLSREIGDFLGPQFSGVVFFQDESFSSVAALERLKENRPRKKFPGEKDSLSAAILLEWFVGQNRSG